MTSTIPGTDSVPTTLERVHMIGIGGAGMSGVARILLDHGVAVSGSDARDSADLRALADRGAVVRVGHHADALEALDSPPQIVVVSKAAIPADNPELVAALVVEDMAPDFRGRTTTSWTPWFESWPDRFASEAEAVEMFGPVAGRYFFEAFDDGRLHGRIPLWTAIAEEWGRRDFWTQWRSVDVPALLIEAEHGVTPPGQMRTMCAVNDHARYLRVPGAGHLIHDDAPHVYRGAVEAFLSGLDR